MGPQHLGTQRNQERFELEVEEKACHLLPFTSENLRASLGVRRRDGPKRGGCTPQGKGGTKPPLFRTQEGYGQAKSNFGPFPSQPSDPLPHFQNDIHTPSKASSVYGSVADFNRLEGGLLARSHSQILPEIPGVCADERQLLLPGHAVRVKRSTTGFHKVMCSSSKGPEGKRHLGLRLPRRLAGRRKIHSGGEDSHKQGALFPSQSRLYCKPAKIQPNTNTGPRMARPHLGYPVRHCTLPSLQDQKSEIYGSGVSEEALLHQKGFGESGRVPKLGVSTQPRKPGEAEDLEPGADLSCEEVCQGSENPITIRGENCTNLVGQDPTRPVGASVYPAGSRPSGHVRRISSRLGLPHVRGTGRPGSMVPFLDREAHKSARIFGSLPGSEVCLFTTSIHSPDKIRQLYGCQLSEERGVFPLGSPQQDDTTGSEVGREKGLVLGPDPCSRKLQCSGRSPVQRDTSSDRMDPGPGLSTFTVEADVHAPPSGFVCDFEQPSSGSLRLSDFDGGSLVDRRSESGLERVEGGVPFSPHSFDFSGFDQASPVPWRGVDDSTLVAQPGMVSNARRPSQEVSQDPAAGVDPNSQRSADLRTALLDRCTTRLAFLKLAYGGAWSQKVVDYLTTSLRPSTDRQYQSVWSKFQDFVILRQPLVIDLDFIFSFLIFIFESKGYQVNTLQAYKCALDLPLSVGFCLDMKSPKFTSLFRSMWLKRPGTQYQVPAWNLDLVLDLLSSNRFNINISSLDLVRKCLFLLGLALGSRLSEVHALLRGNRFVKFSRNFRSVTLIPNAAFLAKNEAPNFRRRPMVINGLFKRDGTPHCLCPVDTLRKYLELTGHFRSSKLFINPISGAPCNQGRIRFYFCSLIRLSQPGVFARFQDLRKFASWKAFWSNMTWSSIRTRGFWRSNSALGRRYLQGSFPLASECVALGRVSH